MTSQNGNSNQGGGSNSGNGDGNADKLIPIFVNGTAYEVAKGSSSCDGYELSSRTASS